MTIFLLMRLAISDYTKEQVCKQFPNLNIITCDLALDPVRHSDSLPEKPQISCNRIEVCAVDGSRQVLGEQLILNVGRMIKGARYKGQDTLLSAFPNIIERFPQAQLLLAGQGDDMERLVALADTYPAHLQSRIFIPGYLDNSLLDKIYQTCYMFAMPSKGEGLGLVYLEAMSRAKPCIGGNVDATPCVVKEGVTGLLIDDPSSPDQLSDKIIWMLEHADEAKEMGLAGYHRVRDYYLFPRFKERFWEILTN